MLLKQTKIKGLQCNKYCLPKKLKDFRFLSTVLGAIIKCKQCNGITVESGTSVKSVNITLKIFAVFALVETVMFAFSRNYEWNISTHNIKILNTTLGPGGMIVMEFSKQKVWKTFILTTYPSTWRIINKILRNIKKYNS